MSADLGLRGSSSEQVPGGHRHLLAVVLSVFAMVVFVAAAWLVMGRDSEAIFDFSTDSMCEWFTAEDMDRVLTDAQDRAGTTVELVGFVPEGRCLADGSWSSSSVLVSLRQRNGVGSAREDFAAHEQLAGAVRYSNLAVRGPTSSPWSPYRMAADLRVEPCVDVCKIPTPGLDSADLSFVLELWPGSRAGDAGLDEDDMRALGFAVADAMLRDMNWVE